MKTKLENKDQIDDEVIKVSINSNVDRTVYYCQQLITKKDFTSLKLSAIGQAIDILRKVIHEIKKRNPEIYTILTRSYEPKPKKSKESKKKI